MKYSLDASAAMKWVVPEPATHKAEETSGTVPDPFGLSLERFLTPLASKTGMAVLTYLGVRNATDRAAVGQVIKQAGLVDFLPVLAVGAGVYLASQARGAVLGPLTEADQDDDLGVQGLLRWVEDLWGGLGPVALIVFPLLTLAAFGLAVVMLLLFERRLESRREAGKVPCVNFGQLIHASAPACPFCHAPAKQPRDVGLLGQAKDSPADIASIP